MSTPRPSLAPIFRSEVQLGVLGATYLEPERRFAIRELIERTGKPQPTVAREVERLTEAGLIESELKSGRRSVWAVTTSPIFTDLRSLLAKTIGPKAKIEDQLVGIKGIDYAAIYGSWAARFYGEPGPQPNDIDVLVVGSPDVARVRAAVDGAARSCGRDVSVSVLSPEEWTEAGTGFVRNVKDGPLVELDLGA
ncbi:MAG: MarR family transcriptional regulator [Micrococcales bacterium]|nr:MarR family transcriptional regulator [Micrococcales bacterium]